jgi:signal transduction histidine kinase
MDRTAASAKSTAEPVTLGGQEQEPPQFALTALTFGIFGIVAILDYATGIEINCTVFYLLAIGIATWYIGAIFGITVSLASVVSTTIINQSNGLKYSSHFAPYWNAAILLTFYLIVVSLLRSLRRIHDTLEQRVMDRTAKLSAELTERKRLESEILVISEREQRRIGHDIHDSLCQHLTGTALAEQYLLEKLVARDAPEIGDAERVVDLIEESISMARGLAAGLSPIETEGEGLITALGELASHFSTQFKVACRFTADDVLVQDSAVSMHLYRIAQEAVHNAIRHGKARNIAIRLERADPVGSLARLIIADDGSGLPAGEPPRQGMGLRNMKYRASMIDGSLTLEPGEQGAVVTCSFHEDAGLPN